MPGYSVLATRHHVPSGADAAIASPDAFATFVEQVRLILEGRYGSCLITEHGRVPVCADPSGTTDPHCFHAHFLLFPGAPPIMEAARAHFATLRVEHCLAEALRTCADLDEYFLFSPDNRTFAVMTRPGKLIRQFARLLVADSLGHPEEANWRRAPRERQATNTAQELRATVREHVRT
jgi:hypothetical protein